MLTARQLERQDTVDNLVHNLIVAVNPTAKPIEWDIETIADIREIIAVRFVRDGVCSEMEFYPYE